ncbi:MAG: FAD-binding protein [Desulfobacteraceae bacterium]|nr:FAD-binding protein [Desulfobacteraceae bacterium]
MTIYDSLESRLKGELHQDIFRRHMLATDASIFKFLPECVAYPANSDDIAKILSFAREHNLSVHARGTGSGVCGSALGRGIVVDFTKHMNRLIRLDLDGHSFECEPGFRMGELDQALKGSGLFFPPDPSSGEYASFGGMYNTNASGAHSVKYGNVGDYCLDADIVLTDGSLITLSDLMSRDESRLPENLQPLFGLYRNNAERIEKAYPPVRFNTTGYNLRKLVSEGRLDLRGLFAGAEGTLGIITRLKFKLIEKPAHDSLVVAYFKDIVSSARAVEAILPLNPCGIEVMDKSLLGLARKNDPALDAAMPNDIDNLLLIGFDEHTPEACLEKAEAAGNLIRENNWSDTLHLAVSREEQANFWAIRKAAVPILYRLKGEKKVLALIEDAAVPVDRLVEYFKGIYKLLGDLGVNFVLFGHISKGLMHTRPMLNLKDKHDVDLLKPIADGVFQLVNSLGGAISGEHGDGRLRSPYIRAQYPDIFELFQKTKQILDPHNLLNPDIITGEAKDGLTHSLRYGPGYQAKNIYRNPVFQNNDFQTEVEKCHGCSKCTTVTHATRMCPVYKATRDEAAAPKAKANILRALISGAIEEKQAYADGLFHVLNHCINCGSCHNECPSQVNIPRMVMAAKADYAKKFGPAPTDRLLTSADTAARLTGGFSHLVMPLVDNSFFKQAGEKLLGISSQRPLVCFAKESLKKRLGCQAPQIIKKTSGAFTILPAQSQAQGKKVLYFPGCYASWIRPETAMAFIKVLSALGMEVYVPNAHCCGLPMLSKGMTGKSISAIEKNLKQWGNMVKRVDHIAVTCSTCGLALKSKWQYLNRTNIVREVAKKTIHGTSLIQNHMHGLTLKETSRKVAYHTPCHLKVQPEAASSIGMLKALPGIEVNPLECHCCGMAGTWGMMAKNFDLSRKIGSDLIQKLNSSGADTGATDCPTCTMQMQAFSSKPVVHPVEILAQCL